MLRICWLFNSPNITKFERESKLYKLCNVLKKNWFRAYKTNERLLLVVPAIQQWPKPTQIRKKVKGTKGLIKF